jgi:O-antigen ligase
MIDRCVVIALATLYAFFPLYGLFVVFAPHPPTAPLVPRGVAIGVAVALGAALIGCGIGAYRRRPAQLVRLWLWPNVAATYLGAALGFDPPVGFGLATVIGGMVAGHFALLGYYDRPRTMVTIYVTLLASGGAAALLAIAFVVIRLPADLYADDHGRAVGTFLNPNELAEYLLAYLGAATGIAIVRRGTALGWFALMCIALAASALALTFSRWGFVAAACGVAAYAVAMRPRRGLWLPGAALAAVLAVNLIFPWAHHEPQDTGARDVAWRAGLATWAHFPLTGVGPLAFERLYPVMRAPDAPGAQTPVAFDPHDLPLSILAETGIVGFAAFAVTVGSFLTGLPRLVARAPRDHRVLAFAIYAGLLAVVVHMLLNSVSIAFGIIIQFSALALAAARWGTGHRAA